MTSQSGTHLTSLEEKIGSGFLRNFEKCLRTTTRQITAGERTMRIQRAENGKYQLTLYSPVVNIWTGSSTFNVLRSAPTLHLCALCGSEN